jgi:cytoskeletal protein CcmA (bactofilin family)
VIAHPSNIEGRVSGSCEIVINGLVKGTIDGTGRVTISEQGRVEATTHGRVVIVGGAVTGDITADEKIELESSARVDGNITAPRILIKDGASFKGQVNMREPDRRPNVRTSSARKDAGESTGP